MELMLSFLVLLFCLIIGISIPLSFLASAAVIIYTRGYDPLFLMPYGYSRLNTVLLLAIPLFVLAGSIMNKGGLGEQLVNSVERLGIKRLSGGLGMVTAVVSAVFGAVSGSAGATLSCIGSIMAPRLEAAGYDKGFIGSITSSAAVLGLLIPPSMSMILYAWCAGQSVLACFLSSVIPGIMLVICFSIVSFVYARRHSYVEVSNKNSLPFISNTIVKKKYLVKHKKFSPIPALVMPIIILGSIYGGILTPTEAAALSVVYAIPVAMIYYKGMDVKELMDAIVSAGKTTGMIMIMLFFVMILSRLYIMENLPQKLLAFITGISENPTVILIMINIFLIILGMLMDDTSGVLLATPILLPIIIELGMSPIHFAAVIGVNLGMGNITPPCAPLLYFAGTITNTKVKDMLPYTMALIFFAWIPVLIITTYFPQVSLFLPKLFGYVV